MLLREICCSQKSKSNKRLTAMLTISRIYISSQPENTGISLHFMRVSQNFCNDLVTWETINQLRMFLLKVVKMTNHTELQDAKLVWYSPRATRLICSHGSEHRLWIHCFRVISPCLIVEVLQTEWIFLTIWLLYINQLRFHLSNNERFWLVRSSDTHWDVNSTVPKYK